LDDIRADYLKLHGELLRWTERNEARMVRADEQMRRGAFIQRLQVIVLVAFGIALALLYSHQAAQDTTAARNAGRAAAHTVAIRIQRSRFDSLVTECRSQRARNRRTVRVLQRQLVAARKVIAHRRRVAISEHELALRLGGERHAHEHAVRFVDALLPPPAAAGVIALINGLQPSTKDCEASARKRVGPVGSVP
jgi:hypothetical protein